MKKLLTYLGSIVLLVGVLVLAIPGFMHSTTNTTLYIGILLVIIGFILHVVFNRRNEHGA